MKKLYYQSYREEVVQLLPEKYSKVLEIGCGEGKFRQNLTQNNEYWGVELVECVADIAATQLDKVLVGPFDDVFDQLPDNYFDLVICNDVIEHLPDHDNFFQAIKSKISNDGCLVASIPNVRFITNMIRLIILKDWKYLDEGILDRTHLRFFTKKSLRRTISDNGYSIVKFIGINPYLPSSLFKRCACIILSFIFGSDIKYLQFGIRIVSSR